MSKYKSLANALLDKFSGQVITRQTIKRMLGKQDNEIVNFSMVISTLNKYLVEDGKEIVRHKDKNFIMLDCKPTLIDLPSEAPSRKPKVKIVESQAEQEVIKDHEAMASKITPLETDITLTEIIELLSKHPENLNFFNTIIQPLGKRLVIQAIGIESI